MAMSSFTSGHLWHKQAGDKYTILLSLSAKRNFILVMVDFNVFSPWADFHACYEIQLPQYLIPESFINTRNPSQAGSSLESFNQTTKLPLPDIQLGADRLHCSEDSSGPHLHQTPPIPSDWCSCVLIPSQCSATQQDNDFCFSILVSQWVSQWYRVEVKNHKQFLQWEL